MRRRVLLGLAGGAATRWPMAWAQPASRTRSIAVLSDFLESDRLGQIRLAAWRNALTRRGWVEGQNLNVAYRYAGTDPQRIRDDAAALVGVAPELVMASGAPNTAALKAQTSRIPIVFAQVADPVGSGLVPSLAATGGNVTGFTHFEFSIVGKWLASLRELAPGVTHVALLQSPANPAWPGWRQAALAIAPRFGIVVTPAPVHDAAGIEQAIMDQARQPGGGMVVLPDTTTTRFRDLIIAQAARLRLPATYPFRFFAEAGGLMAYGPDVVDVWRRAADYTDRILRGEKPGDLPVQAPTAYELVINLRTAQALGLEVPATLLASATETIE